MKKCEHFKDLILIDYIDGALDKDSARGVESHLLECSDCRVFLTEVKNNTALPFKQALHQPVPTELWDAIKQSIEDKIQAASPRENFIDRLKGWMVFPRLVPVFGSLVLMFFVGSMTVNTIHVRQAKDRDQGEYLVSLLSSTGSSAQGDNNDLGTPIEHYFL